MHVSTQSWWHQIVMGLGWGLQSAKMQQHSCGQKVRSPRIEICSINESRIALAQYWLLHIAAIKKCFSSTSARGSGSKWSGKPPRLTMTSAYPEIARHCELLAYDARQCKFHQVLSQDASHHVCLQSSWKLQREQSIKWKHFIQAMFLPPSTYHDIPDMQWRCSSDFKTQSTMLQALLCFMKLLECLDFLQHGPHTPHISTPPQLQGIPESPGSSVSRHCGAAASRCSQIPWGTRTATAWTAWTLNEQ